jgi:hypothetical protein
LVVIAGVTDAKTGETFLGENKAIKLIDEAHPELRALLPEEMEAIK